MNHARDIRVELEAVLEDKPRNPQLRAAIDRLSLLEHEISRSAPNQSTWAALDNDLNDLREQGLWGTTLDQQRLWESLSVAMVNSNERHGPDISIIMPPDSYGIPAPHIPGLPSELSEQINEIYLLHNLATNPFKILPPGKSLLSLLSSRQRQADDSSQKPKTLKDQISEMVTRAFWDEALESLSSPTPAVQLTRLRLLYTDIRTAVAPLIPSSHAIIYTLSDPLSPTSSPLRSAAGHLRALFSVLRARCAPIRDAEIDGLLARLDDPPVADLPKLCIDTVRSIFDVAEKMKEDLADFVVGTWTEHDARRWIRREAIQRERSAVIQVWSAQTAKDLFREWLGTNSSGGGMERLIARLMESLSSSEPVSPISPSGNMLPPPFLFIAFDLLKIQNLLQALVIAASLRSLVGPAENDWISRVWILLEMEVERGATEPAETKLLNLEDEVVQAVRSISPQDEDVERRLREAVRRTLRTQDPVFVLLQSRLLAAVRGRLLEQSNTSASALTVVQMRSGRGGLAAVEDEEQEEEHDLVVKGFEDPVLKLNLKGLVRMLRGSLKWIEYGWGEFLVDNTSL